MKWASVDPFLIADPFWQHKMGMPMANEQFVLALLRSGACQSYLFYCGDAGADGYLRDRFAAQVPEAMGRIRVLPRSLLPWGHERFPADVFHNGDFTYFMPYLIEWRNSLPVGRRFPVTGVTHSLDTARLYAKFIHLLLAAPKPYDAIVCTSKAAVEMLSRAFHSIREGFECRIGCTPPQPPRLAHIPLGLPERAQPLPSRTEARRRLHFSEDEVVILSLGRLSPKTKMDLSPLLEGFAWLWEKVWRPKKIKVTLVLAGAGRRKDVESLYELVRSLGLSRGVRVVPNVSREEKDRLYAAADLFCSLADNYQETFGLTLLEAMEAGLPVLATDFDGYRDLVIHGETGFLIPTWASCSHEPWESLAGLLDPDQLRYHLAQKVSFHMDLFLEFLSALVCRSDVRAAFAEKARKRAEEFRWPRVVQAYLGLWKDLIVMAAKDRSVPSEPRSLIAPSTGRIFRHYPSRILNESVPVMLGAYGRGRRSQDFRPTRYAETACHLQDAVLDAMLEQTALGPKTVGDLVQSGCTEYGLSREMALLHVDWLIKHGMLTPEKTFNVPPRPCR